MTEYLVLELQPVSADRHDWRELQTTRARSADEAIRRVMALPGAARDGDERSVATVSVQPVRVVVETKRTVSVAPATEGGE